MTCHTHLDASRHALPSVRPAADGTWVICFVAPTELAPVAEARVVVRVEQLERLARLVERARRVVGQEG